MKRTGFVPAFGASVDDMLTLFTGVAFIQAQSDANRLTVPFSDPSRPGTVNVSLFNGEITVRASTGRDVIINTEGRVTNSRDQPSGKGTGLRRLSQPAGLSVTEENNVMTINSGRMMDGGDVDIQVPARTNLKLNTVNGDEIRVERIEGDIEVTALNGSITLTDVAGAAVVNSTNGDVKVTLRQVTPDKPMSFTSFNGDVDVMLPANVKANLKMRTDHGEVLTDFDVQIQQRAADVFPDCTLCSHRCHRCRHCRLSRPAPIRVSAMPPSASARRPSASVRRPSANARRPVEGAAFVSNWTARFTARSTAGDRSSSCAPSTATSTCVRANRDLVNW